MTDPTAVPADARPLPTVVGQTKKALDAFLEVTLVGSSFHGHDEWVYANVVKAGVAEAAVGEAVGAGPARIRDVQEALIDRGILASAREFTDVGLSELSATQAIVTAAIADLTNGIPDADQQVVRRVLDIVRDNARAVAQSARPV